MEKGGVRRKMYRKKGDLYKNPHNEKQRLIDSPFSIIEILKVMFFGLRITFNS